MLELEMNSRLFFNFKLCMFYALFRHTNNPFFNFHKNIPRINSKYWAADQRATLTLFE